MDRVTEPGARGYIIVKEAKEGRQTPRAALIVIASLMLGPASDGCLLITDFACSTNLPDAACCY